MKNYHSFHMLHLTPWPIQVSTASLMLTTSLILWFHKHISISLTVSLSILSTMSFIWWRDALRESSLLGDHHSSIMIGFKIGMVLFIMSEIMFFFSFFWTYFQSSLSPNIELGEKWPPINILAFDVMSIPLLNTFLLLSSGMTVTYSHHLIIEEDLSLATYMLELTIMLGILFTSLQTFEYMNAPFCISDAVYGNSFFVATGFHGLHVLIGSLFLIVALSQINYLNFMSHHIVNFEIAAWYWHFVDVVWLFLVLSIYWWGS